MHPDSIKGRLGTNQRPECWLLFRSDSGPAANMETGRKLFLPLSTLLGVSGEQRPEKAAGSDVIILLLSWVPSHLRAVERGSPSLLAASTQVLLTGLGAEVQHDFGVPWAPPVWQWPFDVSSGNIQPSCPLFLLA